MYFKTQPIFPADIEKKCNLTIIIEIFVCPGGASTWSPVFALSGLSEMQSSGGFPVCVPELRGHTEELNTEHPYLDPTTAVRDGPALT